MIITPTSTVGVIGGEGKTGGQFAKLFADQGFTVRTTGKDNANENKQLIEECDVIIFAVPLQHSVDIMKEEVQHTTREDQLLLDLSSLKVDQVRAMSKAKGEVIGMHPLFGPSTNPKGQTIILCPSRCSSEAQRSLEEVLHAMELRTLIYSPEEHDHLMALIQVVPHLKSFLMAGVLNTLHAEIDELLHICTPAYGIEIDLVGRFLDDTPALYGPIILQNPETVEILKTFRDELDTCIELAEQQDIDGFTEKYRSLQTFFGDYAKVGRTQSEACIETLTKLDSATSS